MPPDLAPQAKYIRSSKYLIGKGPIDQLPIVFKFMGRHSLVISPRHLVLSGLDKRYLSVTGDDYNWNSLFLFIRLC